MTVETTGSSWHDSHRDVAIYMAVYLFLFMLVIVLSKLLHERPRLGSFLPEAAMVIIVGMVTGFLIHAVVDPRMDNAMAESLLSFSPSVFFILLLPPIIFNSAYHMRRDLFFRYITPICLYSCLGTVVCAVVIGLFLNACKGFFGFDPSLLELLAFGAIISATDAVSTLAVLSSKQVDPHLFYLVFGESAVNDVVGLVLFESLAHLIEIHSEGNFHLGEALGQFIFDFVTGFVGSLILGFVIGLGYAYFFKKVDFRHTPFLEMCIYLTILYLPFVVAEILYLSGIVTILVTGAAAKRYVHPNLSSESAANADYIFRLVSHITETIIFLELGLSVFGLIGNSVSTFPFAFILFSLIACLIGRAANVYPITLAYNLCVRKEHEGAQDGASYTGYVKQDSLEQNPTNDSTVVTIDDTVIPWKSAHMLWFSGLRGAVSYGLVKLFPDTGNQNMFTVSTMFVVLFTTFMFGGGTEIALSILKIDTGINEQEYLQSIGHRKLLDGWVHEWEKNKLRSWLLRKPDKNIVDDSPRDSIRLVALDEDDSHYQHFELTEMEHLQMMKPTPKSIYDFGK